MKKDINLAAYIEQMSEILDLPINPEYRPDVIKNFASICAIATLVTDFPLPEDIEAAPVFEP
ncbi:DUF4089 domain-containing protein [Microcoleus sp. FACHB-SPT15]|uniref:DUF4089 domain-containing protein n=1 Tax=Microcoleus sp. FACHB-SPT15 TaxID=2692830 RepID=UPI00177EA1C1|nr:DUF4089 domain-containing protein [Microcoleus sp. FACHB-SPT15]MBD1806270.1 DUF4089 domain-containing protein [Microcoleus sp. FACHB-SPT15]